MTEKIRKINWPVALFLIISPIVAVPSLIIWLQSGSFNWQTIVLSVVLFCLVELSITAGYHRYFSHRSYQAALPVKLFYLIFGAAAYQGSALSWSLDHRDHHNYVDDNDKDPYSINKGFLWAHFVWLIFKRDNHDNKETKGADLLKDPWIKLQHRTWIPVGAFVAFALPGLIAMSWGDFWGGVFIAGVCRAVVNHHSTFLINSLSHCVGKQTYSDSHTARDNWFAAFLTFGEGYHNYHHEFPSDYRNGVRAWDWDPTKWLIKGLSFIGMTSNLKKIREEIIVRKRMHMKEKRLLMKLAKANVNIADSKENKILDNLKQQFEDAYKQLSKLRDDYQALTKTMSRPGMVELEIQILKDRIESARYEFYRAVRDWKVMQKRVLAYARA